MSDTYSEIVRLGTVATAMTKAMLNDEGMSDSTVIKLGKAHRTLSRVINDMIARVKEEDDLEWAALKVPDSI